MKPVRHLAIGLSAAIAVVGLGAMTSPVAAASSQVGYDSLTPQSAPENPSMGFQSSHTSEFGDEIVLASETGGKAGGEVRKVVVEMSDWAVRSDYPTWPTVAGGDWQWPMTLSLYDVDHSTATPKVGALISSVTRTINIPWQPAPSPKCPDPTEWMGAHHQCLHGKAFTASFTFSPAVVVPDDLIFGISFDTETFGPAPTGTSGPYISLNVGLTGSSPSRGTDPDPDDVFWNTNKASNYTDGGASGVGTFREDTDWTGDQLPVELLTTL
jgi:hypothetical protein